MTSPKSIHAEPRPTEIAQRGQELYSKALAQLNLNDPLSVYLHNRCSTIFKVFKTIQSIDTAQSNTAFDLLQESLLEFKKAYQQTNDPRLLKLIQLIPLVMDEYRILNGAVVRPIVSPQIELELQELRVTQEKKERYKKAYLTCLDEIERLRSSGPSEAEKKNEQLTKDIQQLEAQLGDLRLQMFKMNSASGLNNINWNTQTLVKQIDTFKVQNVSVWSTILNYLTNFGIQVNWESILRDAGVACMDKKQQPKLGKAVMAGSFFVKFYSALSKDYNKEGSRLNRVKRGIDFWKKRKAMPLDIYEYFSPEWESQNILLEMVEFLLRYVDLATIGRIAADFQNQVKLEDSSTQAFANIDKESILYKRQSELLNPQVYNFVLSKLVPLQTILLKTVFMCIIMDVKIFQSSIGTPINDQNHNEEDSLEKGIQVIASTFPGLKIDDQVVAKESVMLD